MSDYLGDFMVGKKVTFFWSTFALAGESKTRGTNGTVKIHINGGADVGGVVTTDGVTDTEDYASLIGVHRCQVDMSVGANYGPGIECAAILETSVIDGKAINTPLKSWSVLNRAGSPTVYGIVVDDTITANSALAFCTNLPSAVVDFYRLPYLRFVGGALAEQLRPINAYGGSDKWITLQEALTDIPAIGAPFVLVNG